MLALHHENTDPPLGQPASHLKASQVSLDGKGILPPIETWGRKRSVALLLLSLLIALVLQYIIAPVIVDAPDSIGYIKTAWTSGCSSSSNPDGSDSLTKVCAGNNAVYRPSFTSVVFYLLAALASTMRRTANREYWTLKILFVLGLLVATIFIPNDPLFSAVFLNIARIGSILYIIVQYLVVYQIGMTLNNRWVDRAETEVRAGTGTGRKWLARSTGLSIFLFVVVAALFVYTFANFTGCNSNEAFIVSSLALCVAITVGQLLSDQGSLLSTAFLCAWSAVLLYFSVNRNPNQACNPALGRNDLGPIILGLIVTFVSVTWTGWSYHAEQRLRLTSDDPSSAPPLAAAGNSPSASSTTPPFAPAPTLDASTDEARHVSGVALVGDSPESSVIVDLEAQEKPAASDVPSPGIPAEGGDANRHTNSWRLNVVLASIVCFKAMVLTHWGTVGADGYVENPMSGTAAMWIMMGTQWVCLLVYLGTLVAPRLCTGNDVS